ncbi:MAG: hypothetical protein CL609_18600 [Anaerolineaceae bacterium]|nr:hypothetical protein [Anaerolineaceae bacterium]
MRYKNKLSSYLTQYSILIYIIFLFIFFLSLKQLEWSYYFFIFWIGLGINQIVFYQKLPLFRNLLLSWFTGSVILIAYCSLFNLVGLPINQNTVVSLIAIILGLIIPNHRKFKLESVSFELDKFDVFVAVIAVLALGAKVISIRDFYAPILHDPMSHAEWAKSIVETGFISYFYSPGLHILAAAGELLGSFNSPKQILLLTNIFNALAGLPIYLLLREVYKKDWWAITATIFFSLWIYPTNLFLTAGKNAFIISIPLVVFTLFFIINNNNRNLKSILFSNLLIFSLLMTHYPNGFITAIFIGSYYLFNIDQIKKAFFLLPGAFLAAYWGFKNYFLDKQAILSPVYESNLIKTYELSFSYIRDILISTWERTVVSLGTGAMFYIILSLSLFGLTILVLNSRRKKELRWLLFSLIIFVLVMLSIEIFKFSAIQIIYITQILFAFMIFYLSASYVIGEIVVPFLIRGWKFAYIPIFTVLLALSTYSAFNIYKTYQAKQLDVNMVTKYDLEVFEWIEKNINSNEIILNNGIMGFRGIVFPTDSGAWIPAFTFKKIAIPFSDFSSLNTYENHVIHQELIKDPGNCELLDKLLNKGIEYYYRGRKEIYGPSLTINDKYLESGLYELLYEAREAKLYRINGCDK